MTKLEKYDVVVVGAGAAGLLAAYELSKAGKRVVVLEARDRIGGRIKSIPNEVFGYPAEGGAEFVHGAAPVTKVLIEEAGLTIERTVNDMWQAEQGRLQVNGMIIEGQEILQEKLRELKSDIPLLAFLDRHFSAPEFRELRKTILRIVEEYDVADPQRVSTFEIRDDWLLGQQWEQFRIKEGYGTLLSYIQNECTSLGAEIRLLEVVTDVTLEGDQVTVRCESGNCFSGGQSLITVPLPVMKDINFEPPLIEKFKALSQLGFGDVIKILIQFKDRWWVDAVGHDFTEMDWSESPEAVSVWWTQYPNCVPVLTGWIGGSKAHKYRDANDEQIIDAAVISLANIFLIEESKLREELLGAKVFNWPADRFSRGAYSYVTVDSMSARQTLAHPIAGRLFFAGEALYSGTEVATVEGAFASAKEVVEKMLISN